MLLPLARSSNSSAMQTGWWARRYGERPEVNFIRGMGTGTWGGYVKMGAFICRMTTSNQNRQWVKLVNPLKPKRDEIDLFEQSWSLSWLYQQRWISLENKRLFFLGKPYWFSPSAVNGNGFGKFCSFLSLEWTSYPPLIFFPRSQTKRSRNPWGLGIGMPANLYQVTISSDYHCISDLAMDQYLYIPFLVGWTSIYQLFWCSPGVQGFDTLPFVGGFPSSIMSLSLHCLVPVAGAAPCTAWAKQPGAAALSALACAAKASGRVLKGSQCSMNI